MLFTEINLIEPLQKGVKKSGYIKATPIQSKAIPEILNGKDLFGIAQTGTGKTAAFILPILQLMFNQNRRNHSARTLIIAPTRELAAQIGNSIKEYGSFTGFRHCVIFGGVNQSPQERALKNGIDIIVATPGRLLDLMGQGLVDLRTIDFFILDEADRMLDMGFIIDIKKIIEKLPKKKQSLFFSATMSPAISSLSKTLLVNPIKIEVTPQATTIEKTKQGVYFVDTANKKNLLINLIKGKNMPLVLVFTRTKHKANKIAQLLNKNNIKADSIHGNKSQNKRTRALLDFKSSVLQVLVATDIAARGIDVDNISHVINYELPNEAENYVHRIGRTARAGKAGVAYSFCSAEEKTYLRDIERIIRKPISVMMHDKHSTVAQNATGKEAKPAPRKSGGANYKSTGGKKGVIGWHKRSFNKNTGTSKGKYKTRRHKNKSSKGGHQG